MQHPAKLECSNAPGKRFFTALEATPSRLHTGHILSQVPPSAALTKRSPPALQLLQQGLGVEEAASRLQTTRPALYGNDSLEHQFLSMPCKQEAHFRLQNCCTPLLPMPPSLASCGCTPHKRLDLHNAIAQTQEGHRGRVAALRRLESRR